MEILPPSQSKVYNTQANVTVSVCMVAYNHADFIGKAIESVIDQETDFVVNLVIGEDCSNDSTRVEIEKYLERYPSRIQMITSAINVGAQNNFVRTFHACTGRYVALLEGDDFWIDKQKLQKQVDFLDSHPEYAVCAHNLLVVDDKGNSEGTLVHNGPRTDSYNLLEMAGGNMLATASCLYRNSFTAGPNPSGFPEWFQTVKIGDYCLHMLAARHGMVKYFPDVMGVYRVHGGGAWSQETQFSQTIMLFEALHQLRQEFTDEIEKKLMLQQFQYLKIITDSDPTKFDAFLQSHKKQIISLISDDYPRTINFLLQSQNSLNSAEYKWGKKLMQPIRKLVDVYRSFK